MAQETDFCLAWNIEIYLEMFDWGGFQRQFSGISMRVNRLFD